MTVSRQRSHDYVISLNLSVVLSGAAGKPDTFISDPRSRSPGRLLYLSPSNPRQPSSAVSRPPALPGDVRAAGCAPRCYPATAGRSRHVWPFQACPFSGVYFIYSLSGDGVWSD